MGMHLCANLLWHGFCHIAAHQLKLTPHIHMASACYVTLIKVIATFYNEIVRAIDPEKI